MASTNKTPHTRGLFVRYTAVMLITLALLVAQFLVVLLSIGLVVFAFSCLPMPVPYLPTRRGTIEQALRELALAPGDTFYDIGCGDGRVVFAAHRQEPRARCIGVEKRLGWHLWSRLVRSRMGNPSNVEFRRADFYTTSFSDATKIYVFLCTSVMAELEPKFEQELVGTLLVSCNFPFPTKKPIRVVDVESAQAGGIFRTLYVYQF